MRVLEHGDTDFLIEALRDMNSFSPLYSQFPQDEEHVRRRIAGLVDNQECMHLIIPGKGFILTQYAQPWYAPTWMSLEQLLYVRPEYRGSSTAMRLVRAWEKCAQSEGAEILLAGISTGVDVERITSFYVRMGFTAHGNSFTKRI